MLINIPTDCSVGVKKAFQQIQKALSPVSKPYFSGLTLSSLTASRLVQSNSDKDLTSVTDLTNYISGTANEIDVSGSNGTVIIGIVNPLIVSKGGTGLATVTDHSLVVGSGTDALTVLGVADNGEIPIGVNSSDPVLATITGTSNQITVTNGAGTITLSTPQDINTTSNPTFAALTVTSITIGPDTLDTNEWNYLDGLNQSLKTTDSVTFGSALIDTVLLSSGSITDSSGSISFGNENLSTTGKISANYVGIGVSNPTVPLEIECSGVNFIADCKGNKSNANTGFLIRNEASASVNNEVSIRLYLKGDEGTSLPCFVFKGNWGDIDEDNLTTHGGINVYEGGAQAFAIELSGYDVSIPNGDFDVVANLTAGTIQADNGFTGSWTNNEGNTVTVTGGIITDVS